MSSKLVNLLWKYEVHKLALTLVKGKSPSPNGIVIEFYVKIWHIIDDDFFKMVQCVVVIQRFPKGITKGLITLIFKVKDKEQLGNSRPNSFLNTTYKIYANVLQLWLHPILMDMISFDQIAFLPLTYVLLKHETIDWAKCSTQVLIFLKLDFRKSLW
jgi:hypothetical protein